MVWTGICSKGSGLWHGRGHVPEVGSVAGCGGMWQGLGECGSNGDMW